MTRHLRQHGAGRRGALLLLVLGVLTLFMMIGTLMLVLATRTRDTARAFAAVTGGTAAGTLQSRAVLDEALLVLIRGVADEGRLPAAMRGQSLLEDRYGRTTTAVAVAGSVVPFSNGNVKAGPLLQASLRDLAPAVTHPCDLNGRILTMTPAPDDGDVVSYRILRTIGTAPPFTVFLANTPGDRIPVLPKKECRVVINGREFLDEPHDAFSVDPWLTRPTLADSRVSAVPQAAYGGGGSPACDNDGDGVADGVWLPGVVVDRPSPRGGTFSYEVSYLVLDLDGRLNVNAHGTAVPTDTAATWQGSANVPVGLGYGPADVDLSQLLAAGANTTLVPGFPDVAPSTRLRNLVNGATAGPRSQAAADNPRRPAAFIGGNPVVVEGRYGPGARPGTGAPTPPAWLRASINGAGAAGMSPTDLQVRAKASSLRTAGVGGPPALTFFVPSRTASDLTENPYMLRLDAEAPRVAQIRTPGGRPSPADNPFTLAELERVLRPFDGDAQLLPQRLATLLDEYGERCRLTTTTDSWDTPALAGDAMRRVEAYMRRFPPPTVPVASLAGSANTATVYDVVSPDVSAGLRFDVNRPLEYPDAAVIAATELPALKERYCRHLFTLLVALGQPANAATAQWVVNVCDFRDTDSTMTRFRFDTDPTNGWAPAAGDVVVGVERPEVVITETVAWSGAAFAVLYHPWDARLIDAASVANPGTNAPVAVEQVDPALRPTAFPNANEVAINLKNGAGNSVWRLRVEGGGTLALGDALAAGANDAACRLGPNAYLLVQTADTSGSTLPQKLTAAGFNPGAPGAKKVFLERLADPAAANVEDPTNVAFNPYVVVDVADMEVAGDQGSARKKRRSEISFWRPTFVDDASRLPAVYAQSAPWFHWPNRPFVSVAELALVPRGTAREALENFALPTGGTAFPSLACDPAVGLFDAVHVPSRFQGTSFRVGGDAMLRLAVSAERMATTQLPRWREPGRINVNTILPSPGNTVAGAQVAELNDAVWKALARGGPATNPFTASAPADSFTELLALSTTARPPVVDAVGAPRDGNPFFAYATAIRLANTATIRSHVFAVWITLRITDTSAGSGPPTFARLFAIIDRSIPVGFSKGDNMNVRDTIRLQRFLE